MTSDLTIDDIADLLRDEIQDYRFNSVDELDARIIEFDEHDPDEIADALGDILTFDGFDLYRARTCGIECTFGDLVETLAPSSPERFWFQDLDAPDIEFDSHDLMATVNIDWNEESEAWEIYSDPSVNLDLQRKGWAPTDDDEALQLYRWIVLGEDMLRL